MTIDTPQIPDPAGEDDLGLVTAQAGTETPGKNPARFAITVGAGFTQAAPRLGRLLKSNGYALTIPLAPAPPGSLEDQQTIKSPTEGRLPDGTEMELYLPGESFAFGTDWAIPAGTMQNGMGASFTWHTAQAEFPPDPKAAR